MTVEIDGCSLSINDVVSVARKFEAVAIAGSASAKIENSRRLIEDLVSDGAVVYGVTTGFGKFSDIAIKADELELLQKNLILSCCTGVGEPFPVEVVRAMMLLRANSLARGNSGVRLIVVERLVELLNRRVHPIVPQKGSVGSSGDLAPLSHLALVLLGRGQAVYDGQVVAGDVALERAGIAPLQLKAKEGLSLSNGTQAMTAVAVLAVHDAEVLADTADIAGAMTAEALEAVTFAFDDRLQQSRPHRGQIVAAQNLRRMLQGSQIVSEATHGRVQDAYSLRCMPQVHGASRDAIAYVKGIVETEINAATDNPLVFVAEREVLSGGNFHGQPIALAMDFLKIALAELANISERRTERMVNPALSGGLPAFLIEDGGINDGFMVAQYTAAALVSENKVLAHPASVDSIPTSANQEDHVSMGTIAARQAREVLANTQYVLAIELMCACQAMEFRPRQPGARTGRALKLIREKVSKLEADRELDGDISLIAELVKQGSLVDTLSFGGDLP